MAYNSVRERDPLIDKETQRALERRLTELLGIVLIGSAALFSIIISVSYTHLTLPTIYSV